VLNVHRNSSGTCHFLTLDFIDKYRSQRPETSVQDLYKGLWEVRGEMSSSPAS
jgi:hypothetical protein